MQRGFIQIPLLIAIAVALLGSGAFVTYEVARPSQNASPKVAIEGDAKVTADATTIEQIEEEGYAPDKKDSVIDSLKRQVEDLTQKVSAPKTETQNTTAIPKTTTITLPSGAIVEMDANGNIIRTIKEAPQQTNTIPIQTTQNTNTEPSTSNGTQTQPATLKPAPKYSIEYENFSHGYVNSNKYTSTLKYRVRSVSDNAPDIVEIVSRIYAVAATQEFAATLDTWIRTNNVHFATFNDQSSLKYLGSARTVVQEGGASVFKDILVFEKTYYEVYVPARNVSPELAFSINQGGLFPGGYISTMYLNSISIDSTDGNIYKIEE